MLETLTGGLLICTPTGDGTHNLGMCPHRNSNPQHLSVYGVTPQLLQEIAQGESWGCSAVAGQHLWPSSPEPGSMRLPGVPNKWNYDSVREVGSPWKSVCIITTSWEKENPETVYSSQGLEWRGGGGLQCPKEKAHKQLWLTACLPSCTKWANRVWSKIRIWTNRPSTHTYI